VTYDWKEQAAFEATIKAEFLGWTMLHAGRTADVTRKVYIATVQKGPIAESVEFVPGNEFPWRVHDHKAETLAVAKARRAARLREHLETLEGAP
jgi:hypothetical protein